MTAAIMRHAQRQNGIVRGNTLMLNSWCALSDDVQLALAQSAMQRAAETIAKQAEILAGVIEAGELSDYGGPDALRLLAAVVRSTRSLPSQVGHC